MPDIVMIVQRMFELLRTIEKEPKSISDLSKDLNVRWGTVKTYVRILEDLGLVKTEVWEGIPKKVMVKITDEGKCLVKCLFRKNVND